MHTTGPNSDTIIHRAVVTAVDTADGSLTVHLAEDGECSGCPAARLCSVSGSRHDGKRILTVESGRDTPLYRPGDLVSVCGTERMHRRAIMLVTVLPCLALIAVMVSVFLLTLSQGAAALAGLGAMILFFILLWGARDRLAHEFAFTVSPPQRTESRHGAESTPG